MKPQVEPLPPPAAAGPEPDCHAALERAIAAHDRPPLGEILARRGLGPYRGYSAMLREIRELAASGARLEALGRSVQGEPLLALCFGARRPDPSMRTSVILSGLHPMEWIGIETHFELLRRLLALDLRERAVLAVPVANPDGVLRVDRNLRAGRWRFVRHNARGVDLNRNFDVRWGRRNHWTRLVPWVVRPGPYPASEPEVGAVASALSRRRVDRALSLHSFGGAVLYPSAYSLLPVADAAEHRRWARHVAVRAAARAYRALPCAWYGLGLAQGGLELDWLHERHGALSLLVECSRGGFGPSPQRLLDPFAWFNPPRPAETAARIAAAVLPFVAGSEC
ncbi:MAG: hypothetical protein HY744_08400 [Deltaproteobacteria bacterium]|nr:hypothetical protein [Deltaproteobacteria bacterium]